MIFMKTCKQGFMALVTILLLAMSTLALSLLYMNSTESYADSIIRKEIRIQTNLYTISCLNMSTSKLARNFLLRGSIYIPEVYCASEFTETGTNIVHVSVKISYKYMTDIITSYGFEDLKINDSSLDIISRTTY